MENENENENEDGDEDEEEGDAKEAGTPAEGGANGEVTVAQGESISQKGGEPEELLTTNPTESIIMADTANGLQPVEPTTSAETSTLPETLPSVSEHHEIPSNAIEITNTAPGHTEQGEGDLGGSVAGVEIHRPDAATGGDVDMAESKEDATMSAPDDGMTGEDGEVPMRDEGLVMGEMETHAELNDGRPPPDVEQRDIS